MVMLLPLVIVNTVPHSLGFARERAKSRQK